MRSNPNPPPWAARCWFAEGKLHVDLPAGADLPSHRLTFPNDLQGMLRLQAVLAQRNAHSMIGEKGDLTQHQVNKQLRRKVDITGHEIKRPKSKDSFAPELRAAGRAVLRKMGLIGAVQR